MTPCYLRSFATLKMFLSRNGFKVLITFFSKTLNTGRPSSSSLPRSTSSVTASSSGSHPALNSPGTSTIPFNLTITHIPTQLMGEDVELKVKMDHYKMRNLFHDFRSYKCEVFERIYGFGDKFESEKVEFVKSDALIILCLKGFKD